MNKEEEIDKLAKELMERYPGKHDGRFRRAAALGHIDSIIESERSPYAKVRDVKIVLAALNRTDETA